MLGDFLQRQRINPDLPLPQGPICLLGLGAVMRWSGKDGEASVGREGSLKLLIYINKNIR